MQTSKLHEKDIPHSGCLFRVWIKIPVFVFGVKSQFHKQTDRIRHRETGNHILGKFRMFSTVRSRYLVNICKIAFSVSSGQNLFSELLILFQNGHFCTLPRRRNGGHHAGGAPSDHQYFLHACSFTESLPHQLPLISEGSSEFRIWRVPRSVPPGNTPHTAV